MSTANWQPFGLYLGVLTIEAYKNHSALVTIISDSILTRFLG